MQVTWDNGDFPVPNFDNPAGWNLKGGTIQKTADGDVRLAGEGR